MSEVAANEQSTLLDLDSKEFNIMFVEESQPLKVFNNPLHWKAHRLQVALARMDKIAEKNPAQFNATSYFATIDKLGDLMEKINELEKTGKVKAEHAVLDERNVEEIGDDGATPEMGEGTSPRVDPGISADNPFSR